MWVTQKARVLKPWGLYVPGQIVTLESEQITSRERDGFVELLGEPIQPETAEARAAAENAALQTARPKRKYTRRKKVEAR